MIKLKSQDMGQGILADLENIQTVPWKTIHPYVRISFDKAVLQNHSGGSQVSAMVMRNGMST